MASRADCKSAIIAALMALRLSGRFSVMVAIASRYSRRSVEYMVETLLHSGSVYKRSVGVGRPNLIGHGKNFSQALGLDARIGAGFFQRRENLFGGDVADEIVAGERAAAQASERAVEAAAPGLV